MEPGLYPGLPESEYFALEAFSNSASKPLLQSLGHYAEYRAIGIETTESMTLGKFTHVNVLEPEYIRQRFELAPNRPKRSKVDKEFWADAQEDAARRNITLITHDQWDAGERMSDSVRRHPTAAYILNSAQTEQSMVWRQHDVLCKGRLDIGQDGYLSDLKSCADASPDGFLRAAAKLGYYRQAAHYMDGYSILKELETSGMIFIAVESKPPYSVGVYELDSMAVAFGRQEIAHAARRYALYMQLSNNGTNEAMRDELNNGYGRNVRTLTLPKWIYYRNATDE